MACSVLLASILTVAASPLATGEASAAVPGAAPAHGGLERVFPRLPTAFVPNLGQWAHPARYLATVGGMTVLLEERGWTLALVERAGEEAQPGARGVAVRMTFEGARTAEFVVEDRLPGHHNYFLGADPRRWRSEVPLYASLLLRGLYAGIDLRVREEAGQFEYDLLLEPGADLGLVAVSVEGTQGLRLGEDGALALDTSLGEVRQTRPRTWEAGPGTEWRPLECRPVLLGGDRFGFEVEGRTPGRALLVDPGLVFSTYLAPVAGGGTTWAVALEPDGTTTLAGTCGLPFPTTPGAFDTTANGGEGFVTRLSPTGASLVWSTFLGGSNMDTPVALTLDPAGAVTVTGWTRSTDFPTTAGAFDTTFSGGAFFLLPLGDGFVTRLSPTGSSLLYSTFLGGAVAEVAWAVALDPTGAATVVGVTSSPNFPTTPGAYDVNFSGGPPNQQWDAFVTRLSPSGASALYSTFLGGALEDVASAVAVDPTGAAIVAGSTSSPTFPTTPGAFDTINNTSKGFVTRLSPSGASLLSSTFLGGTAILQWGGASPKAIALGPGGAATVAGETQAFNFPTTPGAFDPTLGGGFSPTQDGFVSRLSPSAASLLFSTYLGGTGDEFVRALALDATGAPTVVGWTLSPDFPTTPGAFDTTYGPPPSYQEAFVSRLSRTGASLLHSTRLGGPGADLAAGLALDASGFATVTGQADCGFPTTPGTFAPLCTVPGAWHSFVARLDMFPAGATPYGSSTPGCAGPLAMGVTSWPQVGNAAFAITCGNAPPGSTGLLGMSLAPLPAPLVLFGVEIWIDLPTLFALFVTSDATGTAEVPNPIPPDPNLVGFQHFKQFFWLDPCAPGGISASNAVAFTVLP